MNNNFRKANIWIKVGVAILIIMLGMQVLRYETNIVDWYDSDDWQWLYLVVGFNLILETIVGTVKFLIEKIRNFRTKEEA